jgi:hypothetical protein
MCQYHNLHYSDHGFIVQCRRCKSISLAFGNVALKLSTEQFILFRKQLQQHYNRRFGGESLYEKCMYFPVNSEQVALVLNAVELGNILNMMDEAAVLMEAYEILSEHR